MALSNRTIALLAAPFEGGEGPSHAVIEFIWTANDAVEYLPGEGNKLERVMGGLRLLRDGVAGDWDYAGLPPDEGKLRGVAADLAIRLIDGEMIDARRMEDALERDGFSLQGDRLVAMRPPDEPADRLAEYVLQIFGERPDLGVARNHFEQAQRAFDRGDWEAANSQFRSAYDATYDALAAALGCPAARTGGQARRWLEEQGRIEADEAALMRAFAGFAGRAGSHAGISDATDSQLRRHFATALIAFGVAKLA